MEALKHHLAHHRLHMAGCGAGALVAVIGGLVDEPAVAIAGAVICGAFCVDMIRAMAMSPKRG
ncbi:MAG: hypothetical protein ACXVEM_00230 [Gaiellaceae bacterium]